MIYSATNLSLMLLWLAYSITLLTSPCHADTSELSIAIGGGNAWRSQSQEITSDQGDWQIHNSKQRAISQLVNLRLGLGLSFTTEVWLRGSIERLGDIDLVNSIGEVCLDPTRAEALKQGASLNPIDVGQCARSAAVLSPHRGRVELGGTYRPFDHWSPLIELSIGLSYLPSSEEVELIEGITPTLEWLPIAQGNSVQFSPTWGWNTRLGLGGEVRVWSRWGIRATGWGGVERGGGGLQTMFGLNLSVAYYQYLRLL